MVDVGVQTETSLEPLTPETRAQASQTEGREGDTRIKVIESLKKSTTVDRAIFET